MDCIICTGTRALMNTYCATAVFHFACTITVIFNNRMLQFVFFAVDGKIHCVALAAETSSKASSKGEGYNCIVLASDPASLNNTFYHT